MFVINAMIHFLSVWQDIKKINENTKIAVSLERVETGPQYATLLIRVSFTPKNEGSQLKWSQSADESKTR